MTVESSMKRWLIFSRRFRSAMMWSCEYGADEDDAEILAEALLVGGDPCCAICGTATPPPLSACSVAAQRHHRRRHAPLLPLLLLAPPRRDCIRTREEVDERPRAPRGALLLLLDLLHLAMAAPVGAAAAAALADADPFFRKLPGRHHHGSAASRRRRWRCGVPGEADDARKEVARRPGPAVRRCQRPPLLPPEQECASRGGPEPARGVAGGANPGREAQRFFLEQRLAAIPG